MKNPGEIKKVELNPVTRDAAEVGRAEKTGDLTDIPELAFRPQSHNRHVSSKGILIVLSFALSIGYIAFPGRMIKAGQTVVYRVKVLYAYARGKAPSPWDTSDSGVVEIARTGCRKSIYDIIGQKAGMAFNPEGQAAAISCLLAQRQYNLILENSADFNPERVTAPAAKQEYQAKSYLYILATKSALWQNNALKAAFQTSCPRFQPTVGCLGRFFALSQVEFTPTHESRYSQLASASGLKALLGFIHYGGGVIAMRQGQWKTAGERLGLARNLASADPGLLRLILEAQVESAFLTGDHAAIMNLVNFAKNFWPTEPGNRDVLDAFGAFITPGKGQAVRKILEQPQLYIGLTSRESLLSYLATESLAHGLGGSLSSYLRTVQKLLSDRGVSDADSRFINLWLTRAAIQNGDTDTGLVLIDRILRNSIGKANNHEARHLKGVLLLQDIQRTNRHLQASLEFQVALKHRETWQSLYALGMALAGSKKFDKLDYVDSRLQLLEKTSREDAQKIQVWRRLLIVEKDHALGKYDKVLAQLTPMTTGKSAPFRAYELKLAALLATNRIEQYNDLKIFTKNEGSLAQPGIRRFGDPTGSMAMLLK